MTPGNPSNHSGATEYELIVKSIYEQILRKDGVDNIEVLHDQSITGKSGCSHQIDILWRVRVAGIEHLVLLECKNYGSTVEIGDLRNFHSVVEDINGARGVLITRAGFQSGAVAFAAHHGIGLKLVRPVEDDDWNGYIRQIDVHIKLSSFDRRKPPDLKFNIAKEFGSDIAGRALKDRGNLLQFRDHVGVPITPPLYLWLDTMIPLLDKEPGGPYVRKIELTDSFLLFEGKDVEDKLVPVRDVDVTYWISEQEQITHITADDVVSFVLKDFLTGEIEHFKREATEPAPRR